TARRLAGPTGFLAEPGEQCPATGQDRDRRDGTDLIEQIEPNLANHLPDGIAPQSADDPSFTSSPATARPRTAPWAASLGSRGMTAPRLTAAARAATDWSASVFASSFVTPDFASPPARPTWLNKTVPAFLRG